MRLNETNSLPCCETTMRRIQDFFPSSRSDSPFRAQKNTGATEHSSNNNMSRPKGEVPLIYVTGNKPATLYRQIAGIFGSRAKRSMSASAVQTERNRTNSLSTGVNSSSDQETEAPIRVDDPELKKAFSALGFTASSPTKTELDGAVRAAFAGGKRVRINAAVEVFRANFLEINQPNAIGETLLQEVLENDPDLRMKPEWHGKKEDMSEWSTEEIDAITYSLEDQVSVLLWLGADPLQVSIGPDNNERIPLRTAWEKSANSVFPTMAQSMGPELSKGLAFADSEKMFNELLAFGANVNQRLSDGSTALHHSQSVTSTNLLLQHGADIWARDENGRLPLHHARDEHIAKALALKDWQTCLAGDKQGREPWTTAMNRKVQIAIMGALKKPKTREQKLLDWVTRR